MGSPVEPAARVPASSTASRSASRRSSWRAIVVHIVVTFGNSLVRYLFKQVFRGTADCSDNS